MTLQNFARSSLLWSCMALASTAFEKEPVPVYSANITEAKVLAVQKAWGNALIQIGKDFASVSYRWCTCRRH